MSRTWIPLLVTLVALLGSACKKSGGGSPVNPCDSCSAPEHALPSCVDKVCDFTCVAGYHRVDNACVVDAPVESVTACGVDKVDCTQEAGVTETSCVNGACLPTACVSGLHVKQSQCVFDSTTACGAAAVDCTLARIIHADSRNGGPTIPIGGA